MAMLSLSAMDDLINRIMFSKIYRKPIVNEIKIYNFFLFKFLLIFCFVLQKRILQDRHVCPIKLFTEIKSGPISKVMTCPNIK